MGLLKPGGIGKRLLAAILLFSGAITLTLTGVGLYLEYNEKKSELQVFLAEVERHQLGPIIQASWVMDPVQQKSVMESLGAIPAIAFCALYDHEHRLLFSEGKQDQYAEPPEVIPLIHTRQARDTLVGYLHLQGNVTAIRNQVEKRLIYTLAGQFVKTFLTSFFIIFIAHYLINQHLFAISEYIKDKLPHRKNEVPPLILNRELKNEGSDELDGLVQAINELKTDLDHHHNEVVRYQAEQTAVSRQLMGIFDAMTEAVITLNKKMEILYSNTASHGLFDISREMNNVSVNISQYITIYQDQQSETSLAIEDLVAEASDKILVLNCFYIKSGERCPCELKIIPAYAGADQYYAYLFLLQDTNEEVLLEQATYHATHDHLTCIKNRFAFEKIVHEVLDDLEEELEYSLCLIDLDFFKSINDTFGHAVGDKALTLVARCLQEGFGGKAVPARLGGDEFAALVYADTAETYYQCRLFLDDLLLQGGQLKGLSSCGLSLTASIGVTNLQVGDTLETVFARADKACYNVKSAGRRNVDLLLSSDLSGKAG